MIDIITDLSKNKQLCYLTHTPNSLARSLLFLLPNRIAPVAFELVDSWIGDIFPDGGWTKDGYGEKVEAGDEREGERNGG